MNEVKEELISIRGFARIVGVRQNAVTYAMNAGRFPDDCIIQTAAGRKLHKEKALAAWEAFGGGSGFCPNSPKIDESNEAEGFSWGKEKTRQEALLAKARREQLELQLAEIRGELHHAADVKKVVTAANMKIKAALLNLPSQAAKLIAALPNNNIEMVESILDDYIREILQELSEYDPNAIETERQRRCK